MTVLTFLFRSNRTDIGESSDLGLHHVETLSKRYINIKQNYKFFFQSFDEDFGLVKEEITNDNNILPKTQEGKIVCFLTPGEEPKVRPQTVGRVRGYIVIHSLFVRVHVRFHGL